MNNYKKQQGAVLLIGIILLLVITIIGVSTVSMTTIKAQVAGNSMFTMLTYQGAESVLAKALSSNSEKSMKESMELGIGIPFVLPDSYFNAPSEVVSGGVTLGQGGSVTALGLSACLPTEVANSIGNCYIFEVNGQASLISTSAIARHIEGRSEQQLSNFD